MVTLPPSKRYLEDWGVAWSQTLAQGYGPSTSLFCTASWKIHGKILFQGKKKIPQRQKDRCKFETSLICILGFQATRGYVENAELRNQTRTNPRHREKTGQDPRQQGSARAVS